MMRRLAGEVYGDVEMKKGHRCEGTSPRQNKNPLSPPLPVSHAYPSE